jgi:head-tail adaptor
MATGSDLDRRITIRRRVEIGRDPLNSPIYGIADFAKLAARRDDLSDTERLASGVVASERLARFMVRSSSKARAIIHTDTIAHDGLTWEIDGLKEARGGRRRFIEITAKAGG